MAAFVRCGAVPRYAAGCAAGTGPKARLERSRLRLAGGGAVAGGGETSAFRCDDFQWGIGTGAAASRGRVLESLRCCQTVTRPRRINRFRGIGTAEASPSHSASLPFFNSSHEKIAPPAFRLPKVVPLLHNVWREATSRLAVRAGHLRSHLFENPTPPGRRPCATRSRLFQERIMSEPVNRDT